MTQSQFSSLGIAPKLLEILNKHGFSTPTPIQEQSIPAAVQGKDVMGIAQTGTGKTLSFGLPMIQRLAGSERGKKGLVILPTRELAFQVNETLTKLGSSIGLKTAVIIGGESIGKQLRALRYNPHIIIGTPGRLIDHLEGKSLDLSTVGILVLDEADRMLDMGFAPQLKKILEKVPAKRQTMLFSATMPDDIVSIAKNYMALPLRIEVAPAGTTASTLSQEVFFVGKEQKVDLLKTTLQQYKGSILVFTRTKFGARKIARTIRMFGESSAEIHSDRSLAQRLDALEGFKIGKYRILVATDIAARGIDVSGITLVINYDLPANAEDYVHRIGRTGRAGLAGHAISFATPDQKRDIRDIERLIRKTLPVSNMGTRNQTAVQPPTQTPHTETRVERHSDSKRKKPFRSSQSFRQDRSERTPKRPQNGKPQPWQRRRAPEYKPPRGMSSRAGEGYFITRRRDEE